MLESTSSHQNQRVRYFLSSGRFFPRIDYSSFTSLLRVGELVWANRPLFTYNVYQGVLPILVWDKSVWLSHRTLPSCCEAVKIPIYHEAQPSHTNNTLILGNSRSFYRTCVTTSIQIRNNSCSPCHWMVVYDF